MLKVQIEKQKLSKYEFPTTKNKKVAKKKKPIYDYGPE